LELTVFDPIILPDGRQLVNLRDAAVNITKLLPAEQMLCNSQYHRDAGASARTASGGMASGGRIADLDLSAAAIR